MPHRDPLVSAQARCEQLRARIEGMVKGAAGEERLLDTFEAAEAERARLTDVLERLCRYEPEEVVAVVVVEEDELIGLVGDPRPSLV